jgi:predicted phosphoribosyltransferase
VSTADAREERFADRADAGRILAGRLDTYANRGDVVVLGLPRGGIPVAAEIARNLGAPLDVLLVRKLGLPQHPELAMGAIAEGGVVLFNEDVRPYATPADVDRVLAIERRELDRRLDLYRGGRVARDVAGRAVILVDDGLATGATMEAGVRAVRARGAARVIVAVPVAPQEACDRLALLADEVVAARVPVAFRAVGEWYEDFDQTDDNEVVALLADAAR